MSEREASPAAAVTVIRSIWIQWGTLALGMFAGVHFVADLYLDSTYATKTEVKTVQTLVYDRTRPISERVGSLENKLTGIQTKLDEQAKLQDDRARRAEKDDDEIKADLREIRTALLGPRPRESADVRTSH